MQCWLIGACLAGSLGVAQAQMAEPAASAKPAARSAIVVDGNGWLGASDQERRAFLVGVANMIVAENAYAKRRDQAAPGAAKAITDALSGMNLWQWSERVTAWYRANPDKLSTPVMGVIWRDLVKKSH
ncbi:hypothetical protein FYA67_10045 [Bordetella holmesii]|uniref:N-acetyltransferase YedL n=3 Tax=Bordetella holmesii TaxID=35814 RepID=A0ABN0RYV4_9BORD|nr:hypothetical protein D560_3562 [Bordetella holmesii ATCC 51541]AIT28175.1 hypothetical protein D558_3535 [Bordetella holmesii 44057]AMD46879.1 hypothetical protein H558_16085 [Bordetella holmesii H558]AMD50480.1 hypothetical protein F783_001965 [Bordetella holmesii F627]AOB35776.1 hypothetical protein BBB42_09840 [Bordetella holmesii]EWM40959.1 hypothetical protein D555_3604 [Bordetella holmesii 35009]EWM43830.1 hypothetical protein D556_3534 [Bordetella holmesii 41130]EWM44852.1 hypothet